MSYKHPKCLSGFLAVALFVCYGHTTSQPLTSSSNALSENSTWIDSTLYQMTLPEKIGQLFILSATPSLTSNQVQQLVSDYQPGGIFLSNVNYNFYRETRGRLGQVSNIPLLELSNATTSFNNQILDLPNYPNHASLSALNRDFLNNSLQKKLIAEFKNAGINCTISPKVQSFEEMGAIFNPSQLPNDSLQLAHAIEKIKVFKKEKILTIYEGLEIALESIQTDTVSLDDSIDKVNQQLIRSGLSGVFIDTSILKVDSARLQTPNYYQSYLKKAYNFSGLIFGTINEAISLEQLIAAGATNFLVTVENLAKNVELVKQLVKNGDISEADIDRKVRQILKAKKWLNLEAKSYSQPANYAVSATYRNGKEAAYTQELFEHSIILAKNPDTILPFKDTYTKQFKVVHVGQKRMRAFQNSFFNYANFSNDLYRPKKNGKINALAYNPIKNGAFIITLDEINLSAELNKVFIASINKINERSNVIVVNYGNPHNLALLDSTITAVQVFERNKVTEALVPQLLFGGIAARGSLPVEVASWLPKGRRLSTPIIRLKYTLPEEVGIPAEKLDRIADIFNAAIRQKATPGGQVLVAKDGKIIYSKSFGYHTYEEKQRVEKTDLYDVASVTKAAATTLAAMGMHEEGIIDMKQSLGKQMSLPKKNTVSNILLKDLFIHKSGLQRNMPISKYLRNKGIPSDCTLYFCKQVTDKHTLKVADDFYLNTDHLDSLRQTICQLPRKYKHRRYLYSDVNFYLIHQVLEERSSTALDDYLKWNFYQPLGLRFLTYKPLDRFPADVIAPTQDDRFWRKNLVRGYVHDESAAILGGVGGNAGLFANAQDLAILFQMILNGGHYGGQQFLEKETINYFTSSTHGNHRGLGFDKARYNYTASKSASSKTFGHSGFSGTCVWVDPEENLMYIFLSNRIHPNARNNHLKEMKVRKRIHEVIYEALRSSKAEGVMVHMAGE